MRKLYVWIVIVVAVICMGVAVERYSPEACAVGYCGGQQCVNNMGCIGSCICGKVRGEGWGRCVGN